MRGSQPFEVPRGVAVGAEEIAAHVVVDAVHLPSLAVEVRDGLRADETTTAGHKDCACAHWNRTRTRRSGSARLAEQPECCKFSRGLAGLVITRRRGGPIGRLEQRRVPVSLRLEAKQ